MKTTAYSEILSGVADSMNWSASELSSDERGAARRALSKALEEVWIEYPWPFIRRTELRRFHPDYSSTESVEAGEYRWFEPTGEYYQALRDSTGQNPSTLNGELWETNLAYWGLASTSIENEMWDDGEQYTLGDVVWDPDDPASLYQVHTVPPVGTLPTDADYFGAIQLLNPYVPWTRTGLVPIGQVQGVYRADPRVRKGEAEVAWIETPEGIQIREEDLREVWVVFLTRAPVLTGNPWDSTLSYEPADEEDELIPEPMDLSGWGYVYYATVTAARAVTIRTDAGRVDVGGDDNGEPATFVRNADLVTTGLTDGVDYFTDSAGAKFERMRRT